MSLDYAILGAVAAVVVTGWTYVRAVWSYITSFVIVNIEFDGMNAVEAGEMFLQANTTAFRTNSISVEAHSSWVRSLRDYRRCVMLEKLSNSPRLIFYGRVPLIVRVNPGDYKTGSGDKLAITALRGTLDVTAFVISIGKFRDSFATGITITPRFTVTAFNGRSSKTHSQSEPTLSKEYENADLGKHRMRPLGYDRNELNIQSEDTPLLSSMYVAPDVKVLVSRARQWLASADWYRKRNIPWRMGCLLYGKPGTGKTSTILGIAQDLNLPVFTFNLASMDNCEFLSFWGIVRNATPCIAVFEDFDSVFHGRVNVSAGTDANQLSFDTILNALSGIERSDGILTVITTNCLEHIDPALGVPENGISTRPGRLDYCVELTPLPREGREVIAAKTLDGCDVDVAAIVEAGDGETGAQFQQRCITAALAYKKTIDVKG